MTPFELQTRKQLLQFIPRIVAITLYVIGMLSIFIITIPLMIKRLHDMNLRGWWVLLFLATSIMANILGMIFLVGKKIISGINISSITIDPANILIIALISSIPFYIMYLTPGTKTTNRFGKTPQEAAKLEYILNGVFIALWVLYYIILILYL